MYTVLIITGNESLTEFSGVEHFQTLPEAQAFNLTGVSCTVECIVLEGHLSEDEAIAEYLD